jgi:hypothetical protein
MLVVLDASCHASGADAGHVATIRCCWWRRCVVAGGVNTNAMHAARALSSCRDAHVAMLGINVCGAAGAHAGCVDTLLLVATIRYMLMLEASIRCCWSAGLVVDHVRC